MNNTIYAVKVGRQCGIYYDWDSCRQQVEGFKGAKFMSFTDENEANEYISSPDEEICNTNIPISFYQYFTLKNKKNIIINWQNCEKALCENNKSYFKGFDTLENISEYFKDKKYDKIEAYIDGSYKKDTGEYSCGIVMMFNDSEGYVFYEKFNNVDFGKLHNVAGEIMGAVRVIQYAIDNDIYDLTIIHDYEGIEAWAKGRWKPKNKYTKRYCEFFIESIDRVNVKFKKVKSHSGNNLNNLADKLAKTALK